MGASVSLDSPDLSVGTSSLNGAAPALSTSYAYDPTNTNSFGITATISQAYISPSATLQPYITYPSVFEGETVQETEACSTILQTAADPTFSGSIQCDIAGTALPAGETATLGFRYIVPSTGTNDDGTETVFINTFGYVSFFPFSIATLTTVAASTTTTSTSTTSTTTLVGSTTVYPNCFLTEPSLSSSVSSTYSSSVSSSVWGSHTYGAPPASITTAPYGRPRRTKTSSTEPKSSGAVYDHGHGYGKDVSSSTSSTVSSAAYDHGHGHGYGNAISSSASPSRGSYPAHTTPYNYDKKCHARRHARRQAVAQYGPPDYTFGPDEPANVTPTSTLTITGTAIETATSIFTATNSAVIRCPSSSASTSTTVTAP